MLYSKNLIEIVSTANILIFILVIPFFPEQVYLKHAVDKMKTSNVPNVVTENPLDKLDCE